MKVEKISSQTEHCNFCRRGVSKHSQMGYYKLTYPYDYVFQMRQEDGGGLVANICQDCAHDLAYKIGINTQNEGQ